MLKEVVGSVWRKLSPSLRRKIVRITQKGFTASTAAVIVNEYNEVLLLDHVLRPASGWGIPGGFLQTDEQPEAGVRRELFEETGIELRNVTLLSVRTIGGHLEILFRAEASGVAQAKSREIKAARWFKVGELPKDIDRMQKSAIEKLLRENL